MYIDFSNDLIDNKLHLSLGSLFRTDNSNLILGLKLHLVTYRRQRHELINSGQNANLQNELRILDAIIELVAPMYIGDRPSFSTEIKFESSARKKNPITKGKQSPGIYYLGC